MQIDVPVFSLKDTRTNRKKKASCRNIMKKRFLLIVSMLVFLMLAENPSVFGSTNMPENPFAPEYVLASNETETEPTEQNMLQETASPPADTIPLIDRQDDFLNDANQNPFDLQDPAAVEQTVEFDPETGNYIITETIGGDYFRPPTYMTFDEYMEYQARQQEQEYFNALSGSSTGRGTSGRLDPLAKIDIKDQMIERLFGGTEVDIKPQGNIDLTFGVEFNNILNPTLPQRQQRQGGFDFDMAIQMNVDGSIGEKLKLNTNYNTQATFDFDNTMKLDYNTETFGEDDIIKKIEAGNVSLPLRGTLIQGSQSLFGIKTELQFGRLTLNLVASQQKSERESITLEGGSQFQEFEVKADEYDENRHFFLTHYNREHFEEALSELPTIKSLFDIKNIQVWVTDTRNSTENIRDIVALADLGETSRFTNPEQDERTPPFATDITGLNALPENRANDLYNTILNTPNSKEVDKVVNVLRGMGLQQGRDFEKVTARQLSPTEFTYHPKLGFVSLNINIQPDQVVGVAFEYFYQDKFYKVGQIAEDQERATDSVTQNVLFVKMLKSTIQPVELPTWDLMMKNVYNIGAYNVSREDFELGVYYEDPGEGTKQFMPAAGISDKPLLRIFNLDQLNVQLDPQPDGVFDFVDGLTINTRNGRIMFPVLEPFGSSLASQLQPQDTAKFVYEQLYKQTLFNAREFQEFNRFTIKGSYKSSVSSEISLGAFNIPQGAVSVYSGGKKLEEGRDYEIDYQIGRVRILNDVYLNSGAPIRVEFEDNSLFGFQTKTMLGVRADYMVNKHLTLGGTYLHLFERPYTQKVNIGDDPINNRIYGFDVNYSNEAPWLTRLVDKIPLISTKEMSNINFTAETAVLKPGHARAINEDSPTEKNKGGVVYIDDFEGAVTPLNLTTPSVGVNGWMMSSVPRDDQDATDPIFPEAFLNDSLVAGMNRAHLSWYSIDRSSSGNDNGNPYGVVVQQTEIFPNRQNANQLGAALIRSLDLAYDPTRRGPYNYDPPTGSAFSAGLNPDGSLKDPETRWAGIMRQMTTNDFQSSNIEFLEFWMMSPYLDTTGAIAANPDAASGRMNGELIINFGNISEDIMPDSRKFFENGLPGPNTQGLRSTETNWGQIPLNPQITNNFDTDPDNRAAQDVGLDGLNDAGERVKFADYIAAIQSLSAPAIATITADPSNDNFRHYRSYSNGTSTLDRYDRFFGLEGNTPINQGESLTRSSTTLPDGEDLDGDRTVNETESYFEYRVPIVYDGLRGIDADANPFITETRVSNDDRRVWHRFRIPLNLLDSDPFFRKVGGIRDFRSIRFMRMYLKGFQQPVVLRFATLELVRSQWRRYTRELEEEPCFDFDETSFDINAVNIEENSEREPFGYTLPPGITREQALGVNISALQNEQALSLRVCNLEDGDARGVFKNLNLDMRVLKKLKMFLHAEDTKNCATNEPLQDGDLNVFIRLGSDINSNFYEYEIPITMSDPNTIVQERSDEYARVVWPDSNDITIDFDLLKKLKTIRNADPDATLGKLYEIKNMPGEKKTGAIFRIKGNPNLGLVKTVMVGIRNPVIGDDCLQNDEKSIEIWINELRAFGLDERGGVAGTARIDMQLADFMTLSGSVAASSIGFGPLDKQLADRQREKKLQYDIAGTAQLDKFLPEKTGLSVPFYFQYSKEVSTPQYDPYDLDLELDEKLKTEANPQQAKTDAQTVKTIKSYNFTNVRKQRTNTDKKPMPWDISNFTATYAFDETSQHDPIVESDVLTRRRGALDYNYTRKVKYIEPLKKVIKSKNLKFLKNMNFNPFPNSFAFSTDLDRKFNVTKHRFAGANPLYNTYYNKQFVWNRIYDLQWDITRNLKFQFNADNNAVIDEPDEIEMLERNQLPANDPLYISDIGKFRRDSIKKSLRDFGRTKHYQHNINATYKVPTKDIPFLDWVGLKASYKAGYGWDASSRTPTAIAQGNIINNSQDKTINGDLDFEKLYNYVPYLKKINSKPRRGRGSRGLRDASKGDKKNKRGSKADDKKSKKKNGDKGKDSDKKDKAGKNRSDRDKKKNKDKQPSKMERAFIRPLMAVRKLRLNYRESYTTVIPGYLPDSKLFGMQSFDAPGWGFVAGFQPNIDQKDWYTDKDYLYKNWQWISGDVTQPNPLLQTYKQEMDGKLTIEPFRKFRIDVDASRSKTRNHEEKFARNQILDPANPDNRSQTEMEHFAESDFGTFQVSYIGAFNTLFEKDLFGLFKTFSDARVGIANRLSSDPPGSHDDPDNAAQGYPRGYGRTHPDVLLPAFFAAYTGKDPGNIAVADDYLSNVLIKTKPAPNWRLTYDGLADLAPFKEYFRSISISHGYKGTMSVSSYRTNNSYDSTDPFLLVTEQTNDLEANPNLNYFSRFRIPDVQVQEQFSPLLGVDVRLKNDMSFKGEFSKRRTLALDLEGYMNETVGTDITVGFGYKIKEVELGFLTSKKKKKSRAKQKKDDKNKPGSSSRAGRRRTNEPGSLDITFDFSIRDDETNRYDLFYGTQDPTRGNKIITILPQATYQLNKQLSLRFFFDYRRQEPKTSEGYPTTNIRSGVTVRFSLE
ncbi:MAG TPA: cell surface protein SprA [Bacteroidetes bacterium]|nr:cell surface protein SprA [Bacteroidota bacterium]